MCVYCSGERGKVMLEGIFNYDSMLFHSIQDKPTSITECSVCAQNWGAYVYISELAPALLEPTVENAEK